MEPQAYGHIIFETSFGRLDIELFTRQCPKLTKNFVQLCLDGYYRDTIFNHVEKDFLAIGGVRTDEPNEDIFKECLGTLKDEFHSRLRFTRRGLLATANREKDSNGPEFFFTLGATQELQDKHSIIGRLKGTSVYSLADLNECQVGEDFRPLSEKMITEIQILENPFPELEPRPEIVALIKSLQSGGETKANKTEEPRFNIARSKKLSYQDDEDESDIDDSPPRGANNDLKKSTTVSSLPPKERPTSSETDRLETSQSKESNHTDDDAGVKSARDRRLEEVREQIRFFKQQLECESSTKIRTLTERRHLSGQSGQQSSKNNQASSSATDCRSSKRERERETLLVVENFNKKLKQIHRPDNKGQSVAQLGRPEGVVNYDEEDARLLDELDSIGDDAWLLHKFEPKEMENGHDANEKNGADNHRVAKSRHSVMSRNKERHSDERLERQSSSRRHDKDNEYSSKKRK